MAPTAFYTLSRHLRYKVSWLQSALMTDAADTLHREIEAMLQLARILILMVLFPVSAVFGGPAPGPNEVVKDRFIYYPGTEVLDKKEVRVIACGTGMPDQRRAQASACFLFEFGNGEQHCIAPCCGQFALVDRRGRGQPGRI